MQFPGTRDKVLLNFIPSGALKNYACLRIGCIWWGERERERERERREMPGQWVDGHKCPIVELVFGLGISLLQPGR